MQELEENQSVPAEKPNQTVIEPTVRIELEDSLAFDDSTTITKVKYRNDQKENLVSETLINDTNLEYNLLPEEHNCQEDELTTVESLQPISI